MITKNQRLAGIMLAAALLLVVPLVAMRFTGKVNWTPLDFAVAAALLFGTGFMCELVMRKVKTVRYRLVLCGVILASLLLIWLELAVGIFGTPVAGT